ncbi:MAG: hypothetical protein U0840_08800 [Gemmataceae bacterium]
MKELNPRLKGRVKASVHSGNRMAVKIPPEGLQDLSPLQGLPDLASLDCSALSEKERGDVVDLSPLK